MQDDTKIISGLAVITVLILGGILFFGNTKTNSTVKVADAGKLVRSDSQSVGSENAPVTLVEFGDYQCPACGVVNPVIDQLHKDYSDRLRIVFRNYPLAQHANAISSARAAEAAGKQGKFWEMHDLIYSGQDAWSNQSNPSDIYAGYATQLNLDLSKFATDQQSQEVLDRINTDKADGDALNINGTPTFYINGTEYNGQFSLAAFKSEIDKLLK